MSSSDYSVASLYSGAGGLDLGFQQAGFELQWAIDFDRHAVETYNRNIADHAVCGDVLQHDPPPGLRPDVLIGGPPCQGFSVIGRMNPSDERSKHVFHFLDVVADLRPRAFVMENVKALAVNERWAGIREGLRKRAKSLGYEVDVFVLNASHYGVPQARERMFLIGYRDGVPTKPAATTKDRPPTVREALAVLPRIGEPGNDGVCTARVIPARAPVMRPTAYRGSLMFNGSGRPLYLDGAAKTLPASMGGNATPIIDQDELDHGALPWAVEYHARLMAGKPPLKRAPKRMRRITVQEAAVLQTFPATWEFQGPQGARYRQIGNAVPPNLAHEVANAVREHLASIDGLQDEVATLDRDAAFATA
ncbi:DNA cytosine methyltransferase [Patulibacter sp. NPDC049589]|uniref:DNA cytosine methyltransferase n=1 Tax=Patulibacter sp. NPDC049589 TaxID=3154731 RepID=UPI00341C51B6